MKSLKFRHVLPGLFTVCALSLAAVPALAQSTTAPATTTSSKPAIKTTAPSSSASHIASYSSVTAAKASCPTDTVVWSTFSKSKSYHLASSKYYGKTKHGAYVCEKAAISAGYHASKN